MGGGQCQAYDTQCGHCAPGGSQEKHYEDRERERESIVHVLGNIMNFNLRFIYIKCGDLPDFISHKK